MDDRREKRRLKLMNEVLPLPTQADAVTAPRARTLAHMQRLLTVTAAGAALAGCTKPEATPDAGPSTPDKGATATTTATAAPTASATAEATAPVPPSSASAAPATSASTKPTTSASAKPWPPPRRPVPVVDPLPRPPQRDPNGGF